MQRISFNRDLPKKTSCGMLESLCQAPFPQPITVEMLPVCCSTLPTESVGRLEQQTLDPRDDGSLVSSSGAGKIADVRVTMRRRKERSKVCK